MARNLGITPDNNGTFYFISYNSEDEAIVSAYAAELAGRGMRIWYDYGLEIGFKWEKQIADNLQACEAVIMFFSKKIFNKEDSYVRIEYDIAKQFGKVVYVVLLEDIDDHSVPNAYLIWWKRMCELQCINTSLYSNISECCDTIISALGIIPEISYDVDNAQYINGFRVLTIEELAENPFTGKGRYISDDGNIFEGDFVNGQCTGKGKITWADGTVYEGDIDNFKRHGKGIYTWPNGDIYEGDFIENSRSGHGKMIFADGSVYEGDFEDGKYNGNGIFKWENGNTYTGSFTNGKLSGKGILIYSNGCTYEGDFNHGLKNGNGIFKWKNGNVYEGHFMNDHFDGKGIYKSSISTKNGIWKKGDLYTGCEHGTNGELVAIYFEGKRAEI